MCGGGQLIDWARGSELQPYYKESGSVRGLAIRLLVGLEFAEAPSRGGRDEAVCARAVSGIRNAIIFAGGYFQHAFPLERSGLTHVAIGWGDQATGAFVARDARGGASRGGR